jgi:hypothetical protein
MTRSQIALGAAAAALAIYAATGLIPDAPAGGKCYVSQARGPCEVAKQLDPTDDCEPGTLVYRFVETVATDDAGTGTLPESLVPIEGSTVEVACGTLKAPGKALAIRGSRPGSDCIVGPWRTDAGVWDGRINTVKCCGDCACQSGFACRRVPPIVHAGNDNTSALAFKVLGDAGYEAAVEAQRVSDLPWCERFPEHELCPKEETP